GDNGEPKAVQALARALASDVFWGVRAEAAKALGRARAAGAYEALVKGLEDRDSRVRSATCEGLGELRDARAAEVLRRVLEGDDSYYARAEAAKAIGRIGGERA